MGIYCCPLSSRSCGAVLMCRANVYARVVTVSVRHMCCMYVSDVVSETPRCLCLAQSYTGIYKVVYTLVHMYVPWGWYCTTVEVYGDGIQATFYTQAQHTADST